FTRARRLSHAGESIAANQSDSYRDHDRAHWSVTHVGRWGPTTSEFSLQQEWGERTTYTHAPAQGRFVENPRSPEILNTVLDGKFTTPFAALGDHTLVTGGQVFHTHLTDQNPGRRT